MAAYERFLTQAEALGFRFLPFVEPPGPGATIHLRHDVDNLPKAAVPMAEREHDLGVQSTYFFMLRHENYNLFDAESGTAVRRVLELGHRLGLHVVLGPEEIGRRGGLAEAIRADAELLGTVADTKPEAFSFHNPGLADGITVEVAGLVNTYAPPFFGDITYLSESNMTWRHGPPEEVLALGGPVAYQILVHPYSYVDDLRDDRQLLLHFLAARLVTMLDVNQDHHPTLGPAPVDLAEVGRYLQTPGAGT